MQGAGEGLLAGTGFAVDQQRYVALVDAQGAAEVVLQRRVAQADARPRRFWLHQRDGTRQAAGLAAQGGEQRAALARAQRPTGSRLRGGTAEQVVQADVEEGFHRLAEQALTGAAEQVDRALVHRTNAPFAIERQQPFAEQADVLGLQVETQQPFAFEAAQEVAALDHLGREIDQRHGVELALARHVMPRGGHVEHRHQLALRVEHRAGGTGEAGVTAAEMFVLVDGQRLALDHTGADAVGAFAGLAPVGAEPESGTFEGGPLGMGGDAIEDDPAGIGEQHRVTGTGELPVEVVHLAVGDLQHLLQAFAAFEHAPVFEHRRRYRQGGIEVVILQAAQPGAGDRRVGGRPAGLRLALCQGQHLLGVTTERILHCCSSPVRASGRQPGPWRGTRIAAASPSMPPFAMAH
ncbi:hypothetical protein D3C85_792000 [compost metagenome]